MEIGFEIFFVCSQIESAGLNHCLFLPAGG